MLSHFLVDSISPGGSQVISGDEAHHVITVMRMRVGESLSISDGKGEWAIGEITEIGKGNFTLTIGERGKEEFAKPHLVLVQALTKSDRLKETIELLTEAGADAIYPWEASRSISKWNSESLRKWENAAVAATKQSRRFIIPTVHQPITTSDISEKSFPNSLILIFHESAHERLSQYFSQHSEEISKFDSIVVIIGPEGGVSDQEISEITSHGGKVVGLGKPVFRSAHAGAVALAAIQALISRW